MLSCILDPALSLPVPSLPEMVQLADGSWCPANGPGAAAGGGASGARPLLCPGSF
jgi:hypothetical protein